MAEARGGEALSGGAWARLASMLTVNPALAVLTQVNPKPKPKPKPKPNPKPNPNPNPNPNPHPNPNP